MGGKNLAQSLSLAKFARATSVTLDADARAAGVSIGAAELLAVLREEHARRAVVVPSLARLACLVARGDARPSEATIRRRLNELSRAGLVWRSYRGGRGQRAIYYLHQPRALPAGFGLVGGADDAGRARALRERAARPLAELLRAVVNEAPAAVPALDSVDAYPRTRAGVTAAHSLDSGEGEIGQTEVKPTPAAAAPCDASSADATRPEDEPLPLTPAPRAGEPEPRAAGAAPTSGGQSVRREALALVWAVWRNVWRGWTGRAYRSQPQDGPVAVALARQYERRAGADRELAWRFAAYLRGGAGRRLGSPLWLVSAVDSPKTCPAAVSGGDKSAKDLGPVPPRVSRISAENGTPFAARPVELQPAADRDRQAAAAAAVLTMLGSAR